MASYVEQYQGRGRSGVTLHPWMDVQGAKKETFSMTGVSGPPVAAWLLEVPRQEARTRIANFPPHPSGFYD
jgi:hypothetical protein